MAKNGISVAIAGHVNAGKSSLLNALLGTDRAIVTDIPGTTRDTIEASIEVDGVMVNLVHTEQPRDTHTGRPPDTHTGLPPDTHTEQLPG